MDINSLNVFDHSSVKVKRPTAPNLRMHVKSGTFTLSITAQELIGVKNGDQVMVGQDKLNKELWYLWKVEKAGLRLKPANYSGKVNALIFRNASLAQSLANSVQFFGESGTMMVGKEPTVFESAPEIKVWPLITAKLKS